MKIAQITFCRKPENYAIVDKYVSRSAQPSKDDLKWLKNQGVTDIVNFRTMTVPDINFDEAKTAEQLGMKYHNIPSISKYPDENKIFKFLNLADKIEQNGGKLHIHCKQGADRTGLYSFLYKSFKNIGTTGENIQEWISLGLHTEKYPDLINWALDFIKKYKG